MKKQQKKNLGVEKIVDDITKLSERANEVSPTEKASFIANVIHRLEAILKVKKDLDALAAPQIGINKRIFCIRFKDEIKIFVNPLRTGTSKEMHLSREKCASLKSQYIIPRFNNITAMYQNKSGAIEENKFEGMAAEVFQQMLDLLDGVLISDYGLEVLRGYDSASDEDKQAIIAMYLDSLKKQGLAVDNEITNNPELKEAKDGIAFMESVATGKTDLVPSYNNKLDYSQSTAKTLEKTREIEKKAIDKIKKKYNIEDKESGDK